MERHNPQHTPLPQEQHEQALEAAIRGQRTRERTVLGAWVGATLLALVSTVMLLESCGSHDRTSARQATYTETSAATSQAVVAAAQPLPAGPGESLDESASAPVAGDPLSVPPDVVASVSEAFVTPGQAVEVTVEGTPDITEMALADGRGDAIPMVRDASGEMWRVNYRVPLRPRTDRLGLAVTAKNDSHRWRRVWVFLQVDDGRQQAGAAERPEAGADTLR